MRSYRAAQGGELGEPVSHACLVDGDLVPRGLHRLPLSRSSLLQMADVALHGVKLRHQLLHQRRLILLRQLTEFLDQL